MFIIYLDTPKIKLNPMQTQTHYMSFAGISRNRVSQGIYNKFTSRYVLNDNFFSFCAFQT